jgi:hypothetical protein
VLYACTACNADEGHDDASAAAVAQTIDDVNNNVLAGDEEEDNKECDAEEGGWAMGVDCPYGFLGRIKHTRLGIKIVVLVESEKLINYRNAPKAIKDRLKFIKVLRVFYPKDSNNGAVKILREELGMKFVNTLNHKSVSQQILSLPDDQERYVSASVFRGLVNEKCLEHKPTIDKLIEVHYYATDAAKFYAVEAIKPRPVSLSNYFEKVGYFERISTSNPSRNLQSVFSQPRSRSVNKSDALLANKKPKASATYSDIDDDDGSKDENIGVANTTGLGLCSSLQHNAGQDCHDDDDEDSQIANANEHSNGSPSCGLTMSYRDHLRLSSVLSGSIHA